MFDFDEVIDRRGTHCSKWDQMEALYGVAPADGLAMWVADMDFRPPAAVTQALAAEVDHGVFGYFGDDRAYKAAIAGWMDRRHGWQVDPAAIATTHGVVAGLSICLQAFTEPGDGVILFSPVYHAFYRAIRANGREVVESPLVLREDGRYAMDLDALAAALTGRERILLLCSPHNPGGRIWSRDELRAVADFCTAHDILLVSDEIHHDLILPGNRHLPMPVAAPESLDRLVMLTAATKTFNIAGALTGNAIVPDAALRERFHAAHLAARNQPQPLRRGDVDGGLYGGRRLGRRALRLPRRQRRRLRRRHRRDPRREAHAARFHLPLLGRLLRHRHEGARVHRPRRARRPHRRQPRPHLRHRRRELPAVQPRHAPLPRRGSGPPPPDCLRRPPVAEPACAAPVLLGMTGTVRIGISGWTYAGWRGRFYPPGLPRTRELAHAAARFASIEINGTHYRLQRPETFAAWADQTPPDFVFAVKAGRYITHFRRLAEAEPAIANFLASGLLRLDGKLGPILWQFPPRTRFDPEGLDAFLSLLPHDTEAALALARHHDSRVEGRAWLEIDRRRRLRHALEIRNDSFRDPAFIRLLRRHKVALVCADTVDWPLLMDVTADFVYVRLHGSEELYASGYDAAALDAWADRVSAWASGGEPGDAVRAGGRARPRAGGRDVYVYFDNDAKVRAPVDAMALARRLGLGAAD